MSFAGHFISGLSFMVGLPMYKKKSCKKNKYICLSDFSFKRPVNIEEFGFNISWHKKLSKYKKKHIFASAFNRRSFGEGGFH
jgi:hypothetical protein